MILAMFVDGDQLPLLSALAGGSVFVTPSILNPDERPPFTRDPTSEFARGLYAAQQDLKQVRYALRAYRRSAFYQDDLWQPLELTRPELELARYLSSREARDQARKQDPQFKAKSVSAADAECAAVAITRGCELWSDDGGIVTLVRTLYPKQPVVRLCALLARAVNEGQLNFEAALDVYERIFKGELLLWSTVSLAQIDGLALCR
ncbi:hypothetical protein [Deinococcus sp. UYEF24]